MCAREIRVRKDSRLFTEMCSALLRRGHSVRFRVQGESMRPNLLDGDDVVIAPASPADLRRGDIALTRSSDGLLVHRIASVDPTRGLVATRGDAGLGGDLLPARLFGKVTTRHRDELRESFGSLRTRVIHPLRTFARRAQRATTRRLRRAATLVFGISALLLFCIAFAVPAAQAQTADLQLTQTTSATAVAANQSLGTATAASWAGAIASYTFPTPLPANAVVGAQLTTIGFTPAAYNLTNAIILSVTPATGVITVALAANPGASIVRGTGSVGASQSLGTATAASWAGAIASYTFPTPLPANAIVGAQLTTTGFTPAAYNLTNATIVSVTPATGVITVALAANPGVSTFRGAGYATVGYTYTEIVKNNASSATVATGTTTAYMQTPPNTVFEDYVGANWTCTTPAVGAAGPVVCTYNATLATGATASTLTVDFQIAAGTAAGTTIQNSATVTNSTSVDTVPTNNTSVNSIVVEPTTTSDLALSMSVSPTPLFIFSNLTYTIQVQNLGQLAAPITANVLTDTLPAGLTNVSVAASAGWSCSGTATVSCSITAAMAANTTATITISATAPSGATTLSNTATVSLPGDPNTLNNSATAYTVVQPLVCATPGRDGAGGTLNGIVNTYYPPSSAGTLASGATTVTLGAASGANTPIASGDLLLVIQTQGATINSTNTSSYGDGLPGDPGSGSTNLGSSGLFEFITASSAVPLTGGTLTFSGTGPTGGLLNSYSQVTATTTVAQQTFQVIRVPQYTSATLSSGLVPLTWSGFVGGILALDVSSQLTLGGTVSLDALGFRGGGAQLLTGPSVGGTDTPTDYVTGAPANATTATGANGSKGEGIAGTPRYLAPAGITTASTPFDVYGGALTDSLPGGSSARGAPGNAGGGGTDGHPVNNDYNSGGGAGANGGAGGQGGYGWNSMATTNSTDGGFGGAAFPASTSALVMGGGGGAGTTNNGTYCNFNSGTSTCTTSGNGNGIYSSGGAGGGIIIVHAGSVAGTGTITSNGQSTLSTLQDSTGGGGAGGSILFFANSGGLSGLTVSAVGGSGGNAWPIELPGTPFPGQRHGPGGGGGGGVIFLSAAPASVTNVVAGGSNGFTDTVQDSYGATSGSAGVTGTAHVITETPGTQAGAYCASTDLSVTNSGLPIVVSPGGNITYTQVVKNNGSLDAVNAVFSEAIPSNTTFQSITPAAGWTCNAPITTTIACTIADLPAGSTSTFTVIVQVGAATPNGTQIVDVDNIASGTTDPNLANNTATAISTVGVPTSADLVATNVSSAPTTFDGSNVTMTGGVINQGPATAVGLAFTEDIPLNTTLGAAFVPPAGWACNTIPVGGTGTLTCTIASLASGGSATFPLVLKVTAGTAPGTVITATDNIGSTTPDSNPSNNTATATTVVASAGQADLLATSSAVPNPVSQGGNITYTQSVTNNGPTSITIAGATNVSFTDTIPANTTLAALFTPPPGWTCSPAIGIGGTGTFTCNLSSGQTFASLASANFQLVVKVNPTTAPGTIITNTLNISSSVGDPNLVNNTATTKTVVASPTQAFVTILKTVSPDPVNEFTNLTYTIQLINGGPAVAQGLAVTDVIPSQVTFTSASMTQGGSCAYTAATTTVLCNLSSLGVGSVAVITINASATTFSGTPVTCNGIANTYNACNTATLTTTSSNPNPVTSSSAGSTIQAPTAVDISSFHAYRQQDGSVLIEWRTHEESRNLGFHVYQEDASGRRRLTPSLVAGSALLLRGSRPQHAAKFYRWIDSQPVGTAGYLLEDVDINGTRTLHGPVYPEAISTEQAQTTAAIKPSPLLNQLRAKVNSSSNFASPLVTPRPILPEPPSSIPRLSVADRPGVKISVDHEGWYHISMAQLYAAGLDAYTNLRSLHLFAEGVEQPLLFTTGASTADASGNAIEFYGTGIDTPFSGTRIYWLVSENNSGKHIFQLPTPVSGTLAPASFPFTVIREDRTTYFAALLNGENNDNFFGAVVTTDPVDQDLVVAHADATSALPISLELTLQGGTDSQQHSVAVQFNGSTLGTMEFQGLTLATQSFPVEASLLHEGTNTVTLTALNGDNDVSAVQSIQLHYAHTYSADANWLRATAFSGSQLHIDGFTNPQIRIFDITDPLNISELAGKVSTLSGTYAVDSVLTGGAPSVRTILAFSNDTLSAPLSLEHHVPTFLDDNRAGGDVVVISHPDFVSALAPLVRLRESQGHRIKLVTTDQLYDEYNFGERSPFAIRSFLNDAVLHWQRKPQSVLLVGDASFDPRNYLGLGDFDFLPTRMIETAAFKTASDDWFTDFVQNGFATLPTGRLPVQTAADAGLVVSKIVNYESGSFAGSWNSQAILVADQNIDSDFTTAANSAAANLPPSLQVSTILANNLDSASARSQILSALNTGALLVNYDGHGAEQQWSFANFFNSDDAAALTNGGRLPVYLLMDCLNGFFQDVYAESLAESLLLAPNGGAVAVWASSGFTNQPPQSSMGQAFLHQFASHPGDPIGRTALFAKAGTTDKDVRRTWILFGDPAMKFHLASSSSANSLQPSDDGKVPPGSNRPCGLGSACSKEMKPQ